jgi:hypothetical protein
VKSMQSEVAKAECKSIENEIAELKQHVGTQ